MPVQTRSQSKLQKKIQESELQESKSKLHESKLFINTCKDKLYAFDNIHGKKERLIAYCELYEYVIKHFQYAFQTTIKTNDAIKSWRKLAYRFYNKQCDIERQLLYEFELSELMKIKVLNDKFHSLTPKLNAVILQVLNMIKMEEDSLTVTVTVTA